MFRVAGSMGTLGVVPVAGPVAVGACARGLSGELGVLASGVRVGASEFGVRVAGSWLPAGL